MKERAATRAAAKKDKNRWQQQQTNQEKVLEILCKEGKAPKSYSVRDLDLLLVWHQVKGLPLKTKMEDKLVWWREIVVAWQPPLPYERLTNEDKQRLIVLQSNVIGVEDTIFRREVALKEREL